jgi:ligand-binding SRPBCC domain-containing protein
MPLVEVVTIIRAPIELCFDCARDIDLHTKSTTGTNEKAIGGVTAGLIGPGEEVTWEATHLFVRQRLTSRITQFERPFRFRDSQVRGPFAFFDHDHIFRATGGQTEMRDVFLYESPFGIAGRIADVVFLRSYMAKFLRVRGEFLKAHAEFAVSTTLA